MQDICNFFHVSLHLDAAYRIQNVDVKRRQCAADWGRVCGCRTGRTAFAIIVGAILSRDKVEWVGIDQGDDGESKGENERWARHACVFDEDVGLANFSKEGQRVMKSQMSDWSWAGISK